MKANAAVSAAVKDARCATESPGSSAPGEWPMIFGEERAAPAIDDVTLDERESHKWYESPRDLGDAT